MHRDVYRRPDNLWYAQLAIRTVPNVLRIVHRMSLSKYKLEPFIFIIFQIVLPKYFCMTKKTSFTRQLNLYGLVPLQWNGSDQLGYYHEKFLCGKNELCKLIKRTSLKGSSLVYPGSQQEPKFYSMPYLPEISYAYDQNSYTSVCRSSLRSISSEKISDFFLQLCTSLTKTQLLQLLLLILTMKRVVLSLSSFNKKQEQLILLSLSWLVMLVFYLILSKPSICFPKLPLDPILSTTV